MSNEKIAAPVKLTAAQRRVLYKFSFGPVRPLNPLFGNRRIVASLLGLRLITKADDVGCTDGYMLTEAGRAALAANKDG